MRLNSEDFAVDSEALLRVGSGAIFCSGMPVKKSTRVIHSILICRTISQTRVKMTLGHRACRVCFVFFSGELGSSGRSGKNKNQNKTGVICSCMCLAIFECWAFHTQTLDEMDVVCGEFADLNW